ncbi:MAG: hypothetical protein M3509_11440 [Chloroflexota bacterium]|nr:hypothetical protein [Chloroflexota bacterium]
MTRIERDDDLYRRILDYYYIAAENRISSAAFMGRKGKLDPEVSVYLARLSDPKAVLRAGTPKQRLASLKAAVPFDLGLSVRPMPEDDFPGHCVITGFSTNWKEQCARLAERCTLVDLPIADE